LINTTQSLPNWAFFIDKHRVPQRGDFVVFAPPVTPIITAHFGKISPPFAKRVYGMPGDRRDPREQCGA
jgi:conjugal transfer pilin signal peptidase TrbI